MPLAPLAKLFLVNEFEVATAKYNLVVKPEKFELKTLETC